MVRFRFHREFLDDALKTVIDVFSKKDIEDATGYSNITVTKYGKGIDERCGWDTHIVCENGRGCGFTDGPL